MEAIPILTPPARQSSTPRCAQAYSSLLGGSGASVTVNGGKLNLENDSLTLGDVTVTDNGSIVSGCLTAGSLEMDNATASAALTVTGVMGLSDTNTLSGVVMIAAGGQLYNDGTLTLLATASLTNNGCLENDGTLTSSAAFNNGASATFENYGVATNKAPGDE